MAKSKIWRNVGVAVVAVPMLLYGANTFDSGYTDGIALKVGGQVLTQAELEAQVERSYSSLDSALQQQPNVREYLTEQAILASIRKFVLLERSEEIGLRAVPEEVESWVRGNPEFQVDGVYSPELFISSVSDANSYLRLVGNALSENKIATSIFNSGVTPPELYSELARYYSQSRIVRRIEIPIGELEEDAITEAALAVHYEEHINEYLEPEQVRFEYVLLDPDSYQEQVEIDEAELEESYESRREEALSAAERQLSMILLGSEEEAAEVASLVEGGSFADLARERSLDAGSAEAGGDLGLLTRDDLDQEISDAVFAAGVGDVVGPFELDGEWALFKVSGQVEASNIPFDEVKDGLLEDLREEQTQTLLENDAYAITDRIAEEGVALGEAAEVEGLEVGESDWILLDQSAAQLDYPFNDQGLMGDILANDLLESGETSPLLRREDGVHVLARAVEHKPLAQQTFDEAYDDVREDLIRTTRVGNALARLDEGILKLRNGESVPELDFSDAEPIEISGAGELPEGVTGAHRREIFSFVPEQGEQPPFISRLAAPGSDVMTLYRIDEIIAGENEEDTLALLARQHSPLISELQLLGYLLELGQEYDIELNVEQELEAGRYGGIL